MDKAKFEWLAHSKTGMAVAYLETIEHRATMLQLYQHYYPEKYRESKASIKSTNFEFSEKETEFINLVDENFFPVSYLMCDSERIQEIPVEPLGTWWYFDEFNGLEVTEKFLMSLIHSIENDFDKDIWIDIGDELDRDLQVPTDRINYSKLVEETEKIEGMLSQFPIAIDMLTQSTGNVWLDITNETDVMDCEWKVETIEVLKESYKEAKEIIEKYKKFVDWLDQDAENCVKVLRLWNSCKEVVAETEEESKYLIDVLED